ncbi:hypothetical protein AB0F85_32075 [Nocardia fluminea]|uniref:nSTAND3 domain-containing NTPase n=1 Tax=Nocardia fluminea TaxID=134984 RepID=UPI0033E09D65
MNRSHLVPRVHAAGPPNFELHTLGWRAFQDLCAVVLREVLNQFAQPFADTNDGGRDGAFYGLWNNSMSGFELPEETYVMQCKFMAVPGQTLTFSSVEEELAKIAKLVSHGLCDTYILMTNARLTGESEKKIRAEILAQGVKTARILSSSWLNQTIAENQRLRMLVPRVYGLGDLSQILDERAYSQARALLDYLQQDLATFVPTDSYRNAARAVSDHGFCLLLGEPAVGKSVIAATLAMTALDSWGCLTVRADTPSDVVDHWNVNETNQFFWIDDAFGSVRHEQALTDDWARRMPKIMAAVRGGARVVLTSRDYIYRAARPSLKEYAYPLLREQKVVIDVAKLTVGERRQIVYNHMRLGDQSVEFRGEVKPHLALFAEQEPFLPEVARRLGNSAFTQGFAPSADSVREFMAKPNAFLKDVYQGVESSHLAALALVYQAGELDAPLEISSSEKRELVSLIGSDVTATSNALLVLEGTFLRRAASINSVGGEECWTFRHPTLREGFATFIADNPNLLKLLIEGLDDAGILTQLDCGSEEHRGTLVVVPPSLYLTVARRMYGMRADGRPLRVTDRWRLNHAWFAFLASRCSRKFLETYLSIDPDIIARSLNFGPYLSAVPEPALLARLHEFGLLSSSQREAIVDGVGDLAVEIPDSGWLTDRNLLSLISDEERVALLNRVREELMPELNVTVNDWYFNEQGDSAEEYYGPLLEALVEYQDEFSKRGDGGAARAFSRAIEKVEILQFEAQHWQNDGEDMESRRQRSASQSLLSRLRDRDSDQAESGGRSIFDDVDR